jgi:hypothetical protein
MFRRALGIFALTGVLAFSTLTSANAHDHDWRDRGWDPAPRENPFSRGDRPAAPEIDPAAVASGIALLAGGLLLLHERRRAQRQ